MQMQQQRPSPPSWLTMSAPGQSGRQRWRQGRRTGSRLSMMTMSPPHPAAPARATTAALAGSSAARAAEEKGARLRQQQIQRGMWSGAGSCASRFCPCGGCSSWRTRCRTRGVRAQCRVSIAACWRSCWWRWRGTWRRAWVAWSTTMTGCGRWMRGWVRRRRRPRLGLGMHVRRPPSCRPGYASCTQPDMLTLRTL